VAVWAVDFSGRNIQAGSGALFPFYIICNDRIDGFHAGKKTWRVNRAPEDRAWVIILWKKFLELVNV
jgi:ribosomal protein L24E